MTTKNSKIRLVALAAKSEATLHELGFFVTKRPQYDENQQFTGMKREINPVGALVGAAGLGAAGYGGYRADQAIMSKFGGKDVGRMDAYKAAVQYGMDYGKGKWNSGIDKAHFKVTRGVAKNSTAARIGSLLAKLRFR